MIIDPMMPPRNGDHQRLDERGQRLGRRLDLLVVELGDLVQHRVERAGVLTDRHHLHDHRREDRVLRQRPGQRLTAADALLHVAGPRRASTMLPVVSATMSRHCRIGTPDGSIVPRLRANRLSAIFWNRLPKTGILSFSGSTTLRTLLVVLDLAATTTKPAISRRR